MFARVKKFKNKDGSTRSYLCLVENVYDKKTKRVRQKNIASLGRVKDLATNTVVDRLIESLARYANHTRIQNKAKRAFPEIDKQYGLTLLFRRLWKDGGLQATLKKYLGQGGETRDVLVASY